MMHSSPKPGTNFSNLFTSCASRKHAPESGNLLSKLTVIDAAATVYDTKAQSIKLHELHPIAPANLHPATPDSLKGLYSTQMVSKSGQGRNEYDRMLANSKKSRCCFCSYEDPTELDHFLPKSVFPEFSILPINLIPSCHRCNKLKASATPTSAANCYIHPYYEEYADLVWLETRLNFDFSGSLTITYHISGTLEASQPTLAARIERQFKSLQLHQRYSLQASEEVSAIAYRLENLRNSAGREQVRNHLNEEAQSRARINRNSWQSALYQALHQTDRFCDMNWSI